MNLKNFTSTVLPAISMAKIDHMLIQVGATDISKKYKDKVCTGITFLIYDQGMKETFAFNLSARVQECFNIFWNERSFQGKKEKYKAGVMDQAERTAWKILSDWVHLQCSMILLDQAKPLQLFLPFVYDVSNEETLYDKITSGKIQMKLN
jgi:hypothetical protein